MDKILSDSLKEVEIPLVITNPEGRLLFFNNAAENLFDLNSSLLNKNFSEAVEFQKDTGEIVKNNNLPFIIAGKKKRSLSGVKLKYVDCDQNACWFNLNIIYLHSTKDDSEKIVTSFWDITKEIQIENWFHETAENIGSVLYSTDVNGTTYNFVSDAALKIFGYRKDDILESRVSLIRKIHRSDLPKFRKFLQKLREGKEASVEYKFYDVKNKELYVRHTGYPVKENGKIVRIVGSISNVTDEIEYRHKLEKSEERFRILIETAHDLIFTLNSYGYFVSINTNGARNLGYTPDELIGKHFLDFVDEENKADIAVAFQQILNQEDITSFKVRLIDKFQNIMTYEINARNLKTDEEISGLIGIGRDITEHITNANKLKDLNAKLIEANRVITIEKDRAKQQITVLEELNRLKNEFVSNVSHELRTPLASIVGFAETIATDKDLPREMVEEFSEVILTEGKRLARLINDILDFSKLETDSDALEKTNFNIILVLKELAEKWKKTAEEEELSFYTEIPDAEIVIEADKERLTKSINNLLSNAVKFTNKGGRISLLARDFLKEVEIIVSDTGIGIPKDDIPKLFQKFSKVGRTGTQIPGAGFGLAAVKQIVDLHGGLVKVKSELDKGSTFIIKLPKKIEG